MAAHFSKEGYGMEAANKIGNCDYEDIYLGL
jgi:hypothetical protein